MGRPMPEQVQEGMKVIEAPTYREEQFETSRGTLALRFNNDGKVDQLFYPVTPVEFITVNFPIPKEPS